MMITMMMILTLYLQSWFFSVFKNSRATRT